MSRFFNWKILLPVATMVLIVAAAVSIRSGGSASEGSGQEALRSRTIRSQQRAKDLQERKKRIRIERRKLDALNRPEPEKPRLSSDEVEIAKLSGEMKRLFIELRDALAADNKKRVFKLVHELQAMKEWPDGIPQSLKLKALQALSWFGAAGIAEAIGFLGDADPVVVEEASSRFVDQLFDADGDLAKAQIIATILPVATGAEMVEAIVSEMDWLRPTLRAETALAILDSGNETLVKAFSEEMDVIFGDDDNEIVDREGVQSYWERAESEYEADPDKRQMDEDFYGPSGI